MAHYAILGNDNIVTQVFVGKDENEDGIDWEEYYGAVRTSYNTREGIHYDPETGEPSEDQSNAFRYNYAGIGFLYDPNFGLNGAFIPPKPEECPSWILNPNTACWEPPIPRPNSDDPWQWDEETLSWINYS